MFPENTMFSNGHRRNVRVNKSKTQLIPRTSHSSQCVCAFFVQRIRSKRTRIVGAGPGNLRVKVAAALVAAILVTFGASTVSNTLLANRFFTLRGVDSAGPNRRFLVSSHRDPRRDAGRELFGVEAKLRCDVGESPLFR